MSSPGQTNPFELPRVDRWVQRLALAALLTMAVALVAIGVAFYAPSADAHQKSTVSAGVPAGAHSQGK